MLISKNFTLAEFNDTQPDPRLLFILQWIRDFTRSPVIITDSTRKVREHIEIYKRLEFENKIATLGNGLGSKSLIDTIPWESWHLPRFESIYLHAVDFNCLTPSGTLYPGTTIQALINQAVSSAEVEEQYPNICVGIGVGNTFAHLDVGREVNATWEYSY